MATTESDHRPPPTEREIAEYRQTLDALMARCLASVRNADVPAEALPLQGGEPDG